MLKITRSMKEILRRQNSTIICPASLPLSVLVIARVLADESGMNRTQMGTYCRSEMVAVQEMPCARVS
jgi:hypothetical protein